MISLATSRVLLHRPTAPVARLDQPVTTVCLYASMVSGAIKGAAPVPPLPPPALSAEIVDVRPVLARSGQAGVLQDVWRGSPRNSHRPNSSGHNL